MKIIYCSEPFSPTKPDSVYEAEVNAALGAGLEYELINYEALVDEGKPAAAVRRVRVAEIPETAIYRGWMLKPEQYRMLFEALRERGLNLINSPEQYQHCHYLPESYPVIKDQTPLTVSLTYDEGFSFERVMEALAPFGDRPVILKDYVKSRKHEWEEACFIPSASKRSEVERVVNRFLELQHGEINEGFVFREYVEFEPLARHSKSGMPLTKEFRLFFLDGEMVFKIEYWEEGDYSGTAPPEGLFAEVARHVNSRFFTMDVAQKSGGDWLIVELGDGQVAGLPENADVNLFYRRLKEALG